MMLTINSLIIASALLTSAHGTDSDSKPITVKSSDLVEFESLSLPRRRLIEIALSVYGDWPKLPYLAGSADPALGGFDCSGAMFFVMRKAGLKPPRSSREQFEWLKSSGSLHLVKSDATETNDPSLASLLPGDLVFWLHPSKVTGDKEVIHHVAMYLGTEKSDGRQVIINSSDGRSYRGRKANGYGVYDFRLSKSRVTSRLAGYGTPLGIATIIPSK